MEQGNMLLQGASDANDRIRDQNSLNTKEFGKLKTADEEKEEAKTYYHGTMDAVSGQHLLSSAYATGSRMKNLGTSYGGLASRDLSSAKFSTITNVKSGIGSIGDKVSSVSDKVGSSIKAVGAKSMGLEDGLGEAKGPVALVPTAAGGKALGAEGSASIGVQSSADLSDAQKASASAGAFGSKSEAVGSLAEKSAGGTATGSLSERGIQYATGAEIGSAANVGLGKVLGNVGGAIDVVKDFENIGKKGGFLGGTGASKGDEWSNALTIGGSALDVASIALPFLAPLAALTQLAGAGIGTYESIKDSGKKEAQDTSNYKANQTNQELPPSLAGTGFLASQQSNPMKMISGSTSF